jgi:CDGSH-type Zn-finger protein
MDAEPLWVSSPGKSTALEVVNHDACIGTSTVSSRTTGYRASRWVIAITPGGRAGFGVLRDASRGYHRSVSRRNQDAAVAATVRVYPDGPLIVRGDFVVTQVDGTELALGQVVALCRCGRSAVKPLCDGSHKRGGLVDRAKGVRSDRVRHLPQ